MKVSKLQRSKQLGIGLLELMLSLAIIAVLLVMATRYYQTAHMGEQVNQGISLLEAIRGASAQWAAGKPNYNGLSMTELNNYGLLPKDVAGQSSPPGTGTNPWGGNITVAPADSNADVRVTLSNVPQEACRNMGGKISNQAQDYQRNCGTVGDFWALFR